MVRALDLKANASDAIGSTTGQGIAIMHGPAKAEADPRMPVWSTRRSSSSNARPNQIPDIESSNEDYKDIDQVLQNNDVYLVFRWERKTFFLFRSHCLRCHVISCFVQAELCCGQLTPFPLLW